HSSTQGRWRLYECPVQPALDPAVPLGQSLPTSALRCSPRHAEWQNPITRLGQLPEAAEHCRRNLPPSHAVHDLAQSQSVTDIALLQGISRSTARGQGDK